MNSLAIIIIILIVASLLIWGVWWVGWHPHPTVF
jgi:hypothetical protein